MAPLETILSHSSSHWRARQPFRGEAPPLRVNRWPREAELADANERSCRASQELHSPSQCRDRRKYAPSLTMNWLSNSQGVVLTAYHPSSKDRAVAESHGQGGEEATSR